MYRKQQRTVQNNANYSKRLRQYTRHPTVFRYYPAVFGLVAPREASSRHSTLPDIYRKHQRTPQNNANRSQELSRYNSDATVFSRCFAMFGLYCFPAAAATHYLSTPTATPANSRKQHQDQSLTTSICLRYDRVSSQTYYVRPISLLQSPTAAVATSKPYLSMPTETSAKQQKTTASPVSIYVYMLEDNAGSSLIRYVRPMLLARSPVAVAATSSVSRP